MTSDIRTVRRNIQKFQRGATWRATADKFGISAAMAYRIAMHDYEPKDAHIRATLGLPAYAPAPVCAKCGEVHVSKRCPKNAKPRRNWRWLFGMSEQEFDDRWNIYCKSSPPAR